MHMQIQQALEDTCTSIGHDSRARSDTQTSVIVEDEHLVDLDVLYARLNTTPDNGLTGTQARNLYEMNGPNAITPLHQRSEIGKFLRHLVGGFSLLLLAASALSFVAFGIQYAKDTKDNVVDNLFLGIILLALVLVTGGFTYYQEAKSEKIVKSFIKLAPKRARVLREGELYEVPVEELVVGDIVDVTSGDIVPADIRIIRNNGLKVDNSSLTGESEPQARSEKSADLNPLESKNMAFFSTYAVEGNCRGVVVRTGDRTKMGAIARVTGMTSGEKSPLAIEINHFITFITLFAVIFGVMFFIMAVVKGHDALSAFIYLIGIITANVPEGLLPTLTVCLTLTAQRMKSKNCLLHKLEAVETLGSTSVICTDKTGTLTENKMSVAHLWYNMRMHDAIRADNGDISMAAQRPASKGWEALTRVMCLCSRAVFEENQDHIAVRDRKCNGDASESALLKYFESEWGNAKEFRNWYPKVHEVPFNSNNKYQLSIHEQAIHRSGHILVIKGAPEKIIDQCSTFINVNEEEVQIDDGFIASFTETHTRLANQGERVFGFAHKFLDPDEFPEGCEFDRIDRLLNNLCFVGVVSLMDPPRAAVPAAVASCRRAGIKVIMVTGDHPNTAKAIGRAVGIISPGVRTTDEVAPVDGEPQAIVVHGTDLARMKDYDIDAILQNHSEIIFARTLPEQKLRIVEGCQRVGWVVAVTGDGVNDAPALRKANIGIAMGITGTEVAKQVADMILLDDNFASIVSAIEEGRLLFDNLKKTISYALTANIPELTPFLFFILAGIPLPIGSIAIVLICIGSDIVPAISLAYETAESRLMERKPRNSVTDRLASHALIFQAYGQSGMIESAAGFLTYFVVMGESGFMPSTLLGLSVAWNDPTANVQDSFGQDWTYENRKNLEYTCYTAFFVSIVVSQWVNLIICKTRRNSFFEQTRQINYYTVFALMIATGLAVLLAYCSEIGTYLAFREIRLEWWFVPISFAIFLFVYDELRKHLVRMFTNSFLERMLTEPCHQAGAATLAAEAPKLHSNGPKCQELGWSCIPLALETYDNWGKEAHDTFSRLESYLAIHQTSPKSPVVIEIDGRLNRALVRSIVRAILARELLPS
ncbi:hypothetical protein EMCRGX_G011857 [Ephydatia muelleri]